jgi:putative Ca2+/H+ antiporter (TMEM165/GDT1 family)
VFTLTFLAEWGDRSQIATIGLAASSNVVGVTLGGCLGHAVCTGAAVAGGRGMASMISERAVAVRAWRARARARACARAVCVRTHVACDGC